MTCLVTTKECRAHLLGSPRPENKPDMNPKKYNNGPYKTPRKNAPLHNSNYSGKNKRPRTEKIDCEIYDEDCSTTEEDPQTIDASEIVWLGESMNEVKETLEGLTSQITLLTNLVAELRNTITRGDKPKIARENATVTSEPGCC